MSARVSVLTGALVDYMFARSIIEADVVGAVVSVAARKGLLRGRLASRLVPAEIKAPGEQIDSQCALALAVHADVVERAVVAVITFRLSRDSAASAVAVADVVGADVSVVAGVRRSRAHPFDARV